MKRCNVKRKPCKQKTRNVKIKEEGRVWFQFVDESPWIRSSFKFRVYNTTGEQIFKIKMWCVNVASWTSWWITYNQKEDSFTCYWQVLTGLHCLNKLSFLKSFLHYLNIILVYQYYTNWAYQFNMKSFSPFSVGYDVNICKI